MAAAMITTLTQSLLWGSMAAAALGEPQPPVWPEQFTATLVVNRSSHLAELELAYDWPGGRNLIVIAKQQGPVVWDVEWNNGSSFFIDKKVPIGFFSCI
jgi:hypothetical protein